MFRATVWLFHLSRFCFSFYRYVNLLHLRYFFRLYDDSTKIARQLDGIGPVLSSNLSNAGLISLPQLLAAPETRIASILGKSHDWANGFRAKLKIFPQFSVQAKPV
jgi:hypothetical protein